MNILIKLTCLIGLVIAPILGSGAEEKGACDRSKSTCEMRDGKCMSNDMCTSDNKMCHEGMEMCHEGKMNMKCDMNECAKMSKTECAKMCDEKGCSPEEKAICMAHYGKDGKWLGDANKCADDKKACCKGH
jgi:K(+)-stimulated pyrophosphate-energized sodium pump